MGEPLCTGKVGFLELQHADDPSTDGPARPGPLQAPHPRGRRGAREGGRRPSRRRHADDPGRSGPTPPDRRSRGQGTVALDLAEATP